MIFLSLSWFSNGTFSYLIYAKEYLYYIYKVCKKLIKKTSLLPQPWVEGYWQFEALWGFFPSPSSCIQCRKTFYFRCLWFPCFKDDAPPIKYIWLYFSRLSKSFKFYASCITTLSFRLVYVSFSDSLFQTMLLICVRVC